MKIQWLLGILVFSACVFAYSDDAQARDWVQKGSDFETAQKFSKAVKAYLAASIYADDPVIKANALSSAARAYRGDKLYGKEFDLLERLAKEHLARIDFKRLTDRQYEIADSYFQGHRDVYVSWLPFIHDDDRTIALYETALKRAPLAEPSANARLRLGGLYLDDAKPQKAIETYKEILELHPGTDAARYAEIELANTYCRLAERGDGDGQWANFALESLDRFIKTYPDDPEIPWARKERRAIDELLIRRLQALGEYYHRTGRDDLAQRYLGRAVRNYADNSAIADSERLLAKIDRTYQPTPDEAKKTPEPYAFDRHMLPQEESQILVVPENSDGKWLFPIRDLRMNEKKDSRTPIPERPFTRDDL